MIFLFTCNYSTAISRCKHNRAHLRLISGGAAGCAEQQPTSPHPLHARREGSAAAWAGTCFEHPPGSYEIIGRHAFVVAAHVAHAKEQGWQGGPEPSILDIRKSL